MSKSKSDVFDSLVDYQLTKILPYGKVIKIRLKNGLTYAIRSRTTDRAIIKEVWMHDMYDQHGVKVEKGDIVFDVGAHIGVFSIYAADRTGHGKVHSFEPFLANFTLLEENRGLNKKENLTINNAGVSGKPGTATLYLSQDRNTGGHSLHFNKEAANKVEVKTISLLDYCRDQRIDGIDFLKLDCEGAEFDILMTDPAILKKIKKIIMECHPYGNHTVSGMAEFLKQNGFNVATDMIGDSGLAMIYASREKLD